MRKKCAEFSYEKIGFSYAIYRDMTCNTKVTEIFISTMLRQSKNITCKAIFTSMSKKVNVQIWYEKNAAVT